MLYSQVANWKAIQQRDEEICDGFSELADYYNDGDEDLPLLQSLGDEGDERHIAEVLSVVFEQLADTLGDPEFAKCESPIEQVFFREFRGRFPRSKIRAQVQIGPYRADFVVGRRTVIECDGREFHAQSDGQAQRDAIRDGVLRELGYRVVRFTGSEIMRRSRQCMDSLIAVVNETYQ
jgi:very-short-patch-repair endonuclease